MEQPDGPRTRTLWDSEVAQWVEHYGIAEKFGHVTRIPWDSEIAQ